MRALTKVIASVVVAAGCSAADPVAPQAGGLATRPDFDVQTTADPLDPVERVLPPCLAGSKANEALVSHAQQAYANVCGMKEVDPKP